MAAIPPPVGVIAVPATVHARRIGLNIVLFSLVLFAPVELARQLVPWWWWQTSLVTSFIALVITVSRFVHEPDIKAALSAALKDRLTTRVLLAILLGIAALASQAYVLLPRPYDPVVVLLPYGGEIYGSTVIATVETAAGEKMLDAPPIRIVNPDSTAVYLGWPRARVHWLLGKDEDMRQDAEKKVFEEKEKAVAKIMNGFLPEEERVEEPSLMHAAEWAREAEKRLVVFTPNVRKDRAISIAAACGKQVAIIDGAPMLHSRYEIRGDRLQLVAIRQVDPCDQR